MVWRLIQGLIVLFTLWLPRTGYAIDLPPADDTFARRFVEVLRQHDVPSLDNMLLPTLRSPETHEQLNVLAGLFPVGQATTIETVSWRKTVLKPAGQPAETHWDIELQYSFPHRWLLVEIGLSEPNDTLAVTGVRVHPLPASLQVINRFSLLHKPIGTYLFLCLAIAVPLVMAYSVYLSIRTGRGRRKWLWAGFILLGFCQITVNWTTGALAFNPFAIDLLGAGFSRLGLYGPWMITAAIPVGAIAFLAWGYRHVAAGRK